MDRKAAHVHHPANTQPQHDGARQVSSEAPTQPGGTQTKPGGGRRDAGGAKSYPGDSRQKLDRAAEYLKRNTDLREALGIADDAVLEPHFLGRGEHNENFTFESPDTGKRFVLRINVASQPFHKNQVAYEFAALEALAASAHTPQPLYLDDSRALISDGALVIGFCEGDQLDFDNLREGDLDRVAHILADVHAMPVAQDCPLFRPANPLRTLFDECVGRFRVYQASGAEEARLTTWAERFLAAAEPATHTPCPAAERNHIVNTETLASHFLLPHADSGVQAVKDAMHQAQDAMAHAGYFIDWERPIVGDPAQDVAYFIAPTTSFWDSSYLFDHARGQAFVRRYWHYVDGRFARSGFEERLQAWSMMTALRSTTWCLRALAQYQQAPQTMVEKTRKKLPVYLSDEFMEMLAKDCFGL